MQGAHSVSIPITGAPAQQTSSQTTRACVSICGGICALFGIVFVLGLFFGPPVAELIIGATHQGDYSVCSTSLPSPPVWLIVKGSVGLFFGTYILLMLVALKTEDEAVCTIVALFFVPFVLSLFFQFAWLIVGSVMFWRDCMHLEPTQLNDMMWASLIIGYVSVLTGCASTKSKK